MGKLLWAPTLNCCVTSCPTSCPTWRAYIASLPVLNWRTSEGRILAWRPERNRYSARNRVMKKPNPKIDWQMDDETVWQAGQAAPTPQAVASSEGSKVALTLTLLLLLIGGWLRGSWLWMRPAP